jgi:CheY-like chemotaxis protein
MRKPRVIIYDDDVIILNMLELFFTKKGYEVLKYSSPAVCPFNYLAESCKNLNPCADVIISDYKMPGMTGAELFQRQAERGCRVDNKAKAIISGYADEEILTMCEDSGFRFFINL